MATSVEIRNKVFNKLCPIGAIKMCGMMGEYLIYFNDKLNVPYDLDDEIVANVIMTIYKELK